MMMMLIILCDRTGNSRLSDLLDKSVPIEDNFELTSFEHLHSSLMYMLTQKDGPEKQSIQNRMVFMNVNKRNWILKSASSS